MRAHQAPVSSVAHGGPEPSHLKIPRDILDAQVDVSIVRIASLGPYPALAGKRLG
jgi:thiamine pyrophosphate-dependent acetolactate synthase large subunit-like protein